MYFSMGESGKRNSWRVKVHAKTLLECCRERIDCHTQRIAFWKTELQIAEEKLRSEGITLKHFARSQADIAPRLNSTPRWQSECRNAKAG